MCEWSTHRATPWTPTPECSSKRQLHLVPPRPRVHLTRACSHRPCCALEEERLVVEAIVVGVLTQLAWLGIQELMKLLQPSGAPART